MVATMPALASAGEHAIIYGAPATAERIGYREEAVVARAEGLPVDRGISRVGHDTTVDDSCLPRLTTVASGSRVCAMMTKHKDKAVKISAATHGELKRVAGILAKSGLVLASLKGLIGRCVADALPAIEKEARKK